MLVARPRVPLISRRKALEAALKIIDQKGLGALSIRRLADELGVTGASLYHHFANKEAIVVGAAELALAEVRTPEEADEPWREWLPRNARGLRNALLAHPELIPVIVQRRALGVGAQMLDTSAARLIEEGVPSGAVMPLLDALELFAVGSALHESQGEAVEHGAAVDVYPALAKVMADRGLSSDDIFELVTASILDAIDQAVKKRQAQWMPMPVVVRERPAGEAAPMTAAGLPATRRAAAVPHVRSRAKVPQN